MPKEEQNYDEVWDELTADMTDHQDDDDSPGDVDNVDNADTNDDNQDPNETDDDQNNQDNDTDDDDSSTKDDGGDDDTDDSDADWKALYEKEKHRNASWAGRIRKEREEAEKAKAELEKLRAELEKLKSPSNKEDDHDTHKSSSVNDDEDDSDDPVRDFIEQYPEFEKPLRKLAAAEAERLVKEHTKRLEPDLAAMRETLHHKALEDHVNRIEQAHPGWKNLDADDLNSWIEEQPSYIQATLKNIRDKGTATEVIEMLASYKKARNIMTFGEQVNPIKKKSMVAKNDPHQAVKARGAGPPNKKKINKDDFDAAWDAFAGGA